MLQYYSYRVLQNKCQRRSLLGLRKRPPNITSNIQHARNRFSLRSQPLEAATQIERSSSCIQAFALRSICPCNASELVSTDARSNSYRCDRASFVALVNEYIS
jgi:hypothetical protein